MPVDESETRFVKGQDLQRFVGPSAAAFHSRIRWSPGWGKALRLLVIEAMSTSGLTRSSSSDKTTTAGRSFEPEPSLCH